MGSGHWTGGQHGGWHLCFRAPARGMKMLCKSRSYHLIIRIYSPGLGGKRRKITGRLSALPMPPFASDPLPSQPGYWQDTHPSGTAVASALEHSSGRWDRRNIVLCGCQRRRSPEDTRRGPPEDRRARGRRGSRRSPPGAWQGQLLQARQRWKSAGRAQGPQPRAVHGRLARAWGPSWHSSASACLRVAPRPHGPAGVAPSDFLPLALWLNLDPGMEPPPHFVDTVPSNLGGCVCPPWLARCWPGCRVAARAESPFRAILTSFWGSGPFLRPGTRWASRGGGSSCKVRATEGRGPVTRGRH